jgi:hypothetical protein
MAKKKPTDLTASLLAKDFETLDCLANDMGRMARTVEQFPEDIEYTQENLATLEDTRHAALKLARECESAIQTFEGKQS